ncbi:MAG: insulinase family protein [Deltaproteobacteria bacterium]|nr:insulinase family protein [Deltaproteobacteria bacterium]
MEPEYHKTVLDNGIRIVSERIDHVRSVSIGIWVQCGSRHENGKLNGAAHFIEHMLFKGTDKRTAFDIAAAIDSVGGVMNAYTGKELTSFYIKVPDYHLPLAIDLLADIFIHSRFDPEEIGREKSVVLQEIQQLEDSPDEYVHEYFDGLFWRGHPLANPVMGSREGLKSFNRRRLLGFFRKKYGGGNMVLAAAGCLQHDHLVRLVDEAMGSLPKAVPGPVVAVPGVKSKVTVFRKDLEQVHLVIGTVGPSAVSDGRYPCFLMNAALGGSMSSRLFQEIRERRGLAYTVHSYMVPYTDTGMLGIYVGTATDKVADVITLILKDLKELREDRLTDRELHVARELVKGNFLLSMESTDNRMTKLAKNEICFGRNIAQEEVLARIGAVSREDIRDLAGAMFDPSTVCLAALGPVEEADVGLRWH